MTLEMRRKLIALVTFLSGLYFFLEFVLPETIMIPAAGGAVPFKFGKYHEQILRGVTVVGIMAFGLGLINIVRVHGARLAYAQKGWPNSLALVLGLVIMFIVQGGEFLESQSSVQRWKPLADLQVYVDKIDKELQAAPAPAVHAAAALRVLESLNKHGEPLVEIGQRLAAEGDQKAETAQQTLHHELNLAKEQAESLRAILAQQAQAGDTSPEAVANAHQAASALIERLKRLMPPSREIAALQFEQHPMRQGSKLLYEGFFVPLGAAMFSLLAFYIAKAAYRSFRIKTVEATVMMLTAVVVILGQTPFGLLYVSEHLPAVRFWLLQNINTPGNRAIYFGAAVGGFAMAMRMWLSLEKNPLETDDGASS